MRRIFLHFLHKFTIAITLALVLLLCLNSSAFAATGQMGATEQNPFQTDLGLARAAMAAGDTETALSIYDRLVEENPEDTELRLEAARAHHAAGSEAQALRLGRRVLADYRQTRRFRISGAFRAGILYDSNINQGPVSNLIRLGDWDVRLSNGKEVPSAGGYLGANADMSWRQGESSPWWLVGDANIYLRGNFDSEAREVKSGGLHWGRIAAGARYMSGRDMFDIRFKAEIMDYEFDTNVTGLGVEAYWVRALTPRFHLIADAGFEWRDYSDSGERDGNFGRAGAYGRFIFGGAGHEFMIGGGYIGASANRNDYAYDGWRGLARFNLRLPRGFTISPGISFAQEFYKGPGTALETEKRQDDRLRVGADLSYSINDAWSVEASYHYVNSNSTSALYDYDQHVVSLGMARKF